jgi:hypothetical protein
MASFHLASQPIELSMYRTVNERVRIFADGARH